MVICSIHPSRLKSSRLILYFIVLQNYFPHLLCWAVTSPSAEPEIYITYKAITRLLYYIALYCWLYCILVYIYVKETILLRIVLWRVTMPNNPQHRLKIRSNSTQLFINKNIIVYLPYNINDFHNLIFMYIIINLTTPY